MISWSPCPFVWFDHGNGTVSFMSVRALQLGAVKKDSVGVELYAPKLMPVRITIPDKNARLFFAGILTKFLATGPDEITTQIYSDAGLDLNQLLKIADGLSKQVEAQKVVDESGRKL